jgi:beta-galactosidase
MTRLNGALLSASILVVMDSARIVKLLLVLGALVGGILAAKAEPPARTRAKLDSQWCFQQGDPAGAEQAGFDDRSWQTVELPHDWAVDQPINEANPRYNGFYPRGIGWYRRHLELDSSWLGRQVYLEFEGVYRDSTLWVNGRKVGSHRSGYTGVVYDLTSCLHFDGQPNLLALRVDGRDGEGWWYEGDGIYRHVWLIATDKIHVANWGTFLTTPRVSTTGTAVRARITVQNDTAADQNCRLRTEFLDAQGQTVGLVESEGTVGANSSRDLTQETTVANPHLWSHSATIFPPSCQECSPSDRYNETLLKNAKLETGDPARSWNACAHDVRSDTGDASGRRGERRAGGSPGLPKRDGRLPHVPHPRHRARNERNFACFCRGPEEPVRGHRRH